MNKPDTIELCLPRGNTKVGRVWTFSLPSFLSCPGASSWCRKHCYARRFEALRPNCRQAYLRNMVLSLDEKPFVRHLLAALPQNAPLVRLHVSGDFYSSEYISAIQEVCEARSQTTFWAYTRSWLIPSLRPALESFRMLSNVNLFASVDPDMPDPPVGWRAAFVECDPRATGLSCRHQQGEVESCLECGHCFRIRNGHVVFSTH